ncbi:MAG: hypothetical protein BroJett011_61990 [Chloroflexota bacterium]|nr:MAG: hypothetical protein BroJett011_61990 [Chloroflexota bacterium]
MNLLQRVANSDKDPQRTIAALRLLIAHFERDLKRPAPSAGQKAPERQAQPKETNF